MEGIQAFLDAIPNAAANPLALVAYLATLVAWVVIALRVKRFRILMDKIEALPEKDRLKAIEAEIGRVKIRFGLTAEQYLQSRIHTFILIGFLAGCATVVLVAGTALVRVYEQKERADGYTRELVDNPSSSYMSAVDMLADGPEMIAEARQEIRLPMTNNELADVVDSLAQQHMSREQIEARLTKMTGTRRLQHANTALANAAATANESFKKLSNCFRDVECRQGDEFAKMCNVVGHVAANIQAINDSARQIPGLNFNATGAPPILGGGTNGIGFNQISATNIAYLSKQVCAAAALRPVP
jgi:hypothetical protein